MVHMISLKGKGTCLLNNVAGSFAYKCMYVSILLETERTSLKSEINKRIAHSQPSQHSCTLEEWSCLSGCAH